MKLQIFSDIHLEFGTPPTPPITGDIIVAAGDIGVGIEGLVWLSQFDRPVVYVAGNHEFYDCDLDETRQELAEFAETMGIHFLDNRAVEIAGVRFLGCTLWTDFDQRRAPFYHYATDLMNDFRMIRREGRNLSPIDVVELHQESRGWLQESLEGAAQQGNAATALSAAGAAAATAPYTPTVVVTHHAPSRQSWDEDRDVLFRPAYCNDLEHLLAEHPIDLWVHGHVHHRHDYALHGTRVVCNPRGYAGYQVVDDHDVTFTVELDRP